MKQEERNAKTEHDIIHAFVRLMKEKGLKNIKVTDITREAGVGRGTFYLHYLDINDLLAKLEDRLMAILEEDLDQVMSEDFLHLTGQSERHADSLYGVVLKVLNRFDEERDMISTLLSEQGDLTLRNRIETLFRSKLHHTLKESGSRFFNNQKIPEEYTEEMIMGSVMAIVMHWLSKPDPESPKQIAQIIWDSQFVAPNDVLHEDN
ncbi:TetR/AcrR family transcriptional regulator [Levilactobacillus bambusae]|uniref:TetR/AcrR family transcriptional regulator n=1 Tax=Levilactobacillus bambusae TaxID=2024736 RepID=A0A2V1MZG4_9LACO|nr:TetR/AcrR family transcriptional regulator [Levilactobacillus bambusae]PWG00359.1 TetR/AcrR family transcriptional regulator [Levilactobacillus bambusae]